MLAHGIIRLATPVLKGVKFSELSAIISFRLENTCRLSIKLLLLALLIHPKAVFRGGMRGVQTPPPPRNISMSLNYDSPSPAIVET